MENKICIVILYFGALGEKFDLFYESCRRNRNIDWLIFSDDISYHSNGNINIIQCTLEDINKLIKNKFKTKTNLTNPYKLCDLKPFYGFLFSDYLKKYDYWGYGDLDVVYGDLYNFLERIDYVQYDKINRMGHLCIVRNNEKCVKAFMTECDGSISYKAILDDMGKNYGFDERDYNQKCDKLGLKVYSGIFAADIDTYYRRMRCVDMRTTKYLCKVSNVDWTPTNYRKQIFVLQDGRVYRYHIKNNQVIKEEFAYIHYRWAGKIEFEDVNSNSFVISRKGFFPVEKNHLSDVQHLTGLIESYNGYENALIETVRFVYFYLRERRNR